MRRREITEKQRAFTEAYYTAGSETFGNGRESARKAGYRGSDAYLDTMGSKLVRNNKVIALKKQIQAKTAKEYKHTEAVAIAGLYSDLAYLDEQAQAGNIQAIQARTAIRKELNNICGLQHQNIHTDIQQPEPLTAEEINEYRQAARQLTSIRLSKSG